MKFSARIFRNEEKAKAYGEKICRELAIPATTRIGAEIVMMVNDAARFSPVIETSWGTISSNLPSKGWAILVHYCGSVRSLVLDQDTMKKVGACMGYRFNELGDNALALRKDLDSITAQQQEILDRLKMVYSNDRNT